MLNLFPQRQSNCEHSRRHFMVQAGTLAGVSLSLDSLLRAEAAAAKKDVNCILIWTRGGTSHHDTLDPKPQAKAEVRGDFGVINTALSGVQFTDQMPRFAKDVGEFAVMRNLNPQNGSHGTADAFMMSGHKFNPSITYPTFGSVVSREKGFRATIPPFIQIGTQIDRRFNGGTAGYLGLAHNPFEIPGDPNSKSFTVRDIKPYGGISSARMDDRRNALKLIDTFQRTAEQQPDALAAVDEHYRNAFSIMTSKDTQEAFDLQAETDAVRDDYGRHNLGQSCLLARRLAERGVRFIQLYHRGWDHHGGIKNASQGTARLCDQGAAALIKDLKQRDMLKDTLVIWASEFGRTPMAQGSGRDHHIKGFSMWMAGGGAKGGTTYGATDELGYNAVENVVTVHDMHATMLHLLGIDHERMTVRFQGRDFRLTDVHGNVVHDILA